MSAMINNVVNSSGTARASTELTDTQTKLLQQSGLDPSSDEYKQTALKFKVQNLQNAVSLANELMSSFNEMRKKSVEGMRA
jgi:hypothetical protein